MKQELTPKEFREIDTILFDMIGKIEGLLVVVDTTPASFPRARAILRHLNRAQKELQKARDKVAA